MATTKKAPAKKTVTKKATVKKAAVKKPVAKKTGPKADVPGWSTIHIFGYGETQIIGKEHNGKVANTKLKALEALIAALAETQQKGTKVNLNDTHALNIFNGAFIDFRPKPAAKNKPQRFAWSEVKTEDIDRLVKELISKVPEQKQRKNFIDMIKK